MKACLQGSLVCPYSRGGGSTASYSCDYGGYCDHQLPKDSRDTEKGEGE